MAGEPRRAWQDRVYLARALLQRPTSLILDESLSALDPLTMREVFAALSARICVFERT